MLVDFYSQPFLSSYWMWIPKIREKKTAPLWISTLKEKENVQLSRLLLGRLVVFID